MTFMDCCVMGLWSLVREEVNTVRIINFSNDCVARTVFRSSGDLRRQRQNLGRSVSKRINNCVKFV